MQMLKGTFTTMLLFFTFWGTAQNVTTKYIERFLPLSQHLSKRWGIPTSIILGVSIHESGSGTSINCRQLNNYFGVKGHNHLKKRHTAYKQYIDAEESFRDFCGILSRKTFFLKLKDNMNYKLWLTNMNKSHYAGAKEIWIQRIKAIIKHFKLHKKDKVVNPDEEESNM